MIFLKQHIYLLIFILSVSEWPITSFVSAWFAANWVLKIEYIIIITCLWDIIWDIILYLVWMIFHRVSLLKKFHTFATKRNLLKKLYGRSKFLYFVLVKITPYLSAPSLLSLWMKKTNFWTFLKYSVIVSVLVKSVYLSLWYIWTISVQQLTKFLDVWKQVAVYLLAGIIILWWIKKLHKLIYKNIKKEVIQEK